MDNTYKVTEIVGSSSNSLEEAVRNGVERASQTLRNLGWFEVTEIRGRVDNGSIAYFQATMKVGFRLEDA